MSDLIPVTVDDGHVIYVEASEGVQRRGSGIEEASALSAGEKALDTASQLSRAVSGFCTRIVGSLRELQASAKPSKATIEFGLNISLEGNVYVVKTAGQASIKISAEWKLD